MKKLCIKSLEGFCTLLLLTLVLQGCAGVRPDVDVSMISSADEEAYSEFVNPFVLQRLGAAIQDESVQNYIQRVGASLYVEKSGYTFTLVNDPAPAAFALPAGEIVLTRGLFHHLESEEELIALLAHLIGHDMSRHGIQLALTTQSATGNVSLFSIPDMYAAAAVSSGLLTAPFSDEQEIIADQNAEIILAQSGFELTSVTMLISHIYERLEKLSRFQAGTMILNHPLSSNRLKAALGNDKNLAYNAQGKDLDSLSFVEVMDALLETRPAYELYQQALDLEKQGEVDQSISLYLQAAVAAPEESLILTGLGMVYMREGILVAARQHLTRASRIDSYYYYPQLGLGYIYLQQEDFIQAAKRLRRSQKLLPTAQGGYLLARVFDETANTQAALTAYQDVARYYKGSQMGLLAEKRIVELESSLELE